MVAAPSDTALREEESRGGGAKERMRGGEDERRRGGGEKEGRRRGEGGEKEARGSEGRAERSSASECVGNVVTEMRHEMSETPDVERRESKRDAARAVSSGEVREEQGSKGVREARNRGKKQGSEGRKRAKKQGREGARE
eukprot:3449971-Rhodomonas_salina.1